MKYVSGNGSFDKVRSSGNDLYNMLAVVSGDPEIVQKLANPNAAMAMRQRQTVPVLAVRRYLRDLKNDYQFLTSLETALGIDETSNPSCLALAALGEFSLNPTVTFTPESLRLRAWACPCEP